MKTLFIVSLLTVSALPAFARRHSNSYNNNSYSNNYGSTYVNGYTRSNGTYVEPYHRSNSDSYKFNNYGSKGNTNPYTGSRGTVSWDD